MGDDVMLKFMLKQTVTVTKPASRDGWGVLIPGKSVDLRARVSEETRVVTNNLGEEAVSSMTIYLDKMADVSYDDTITYTNELGVEIKRKPISIQPKRFINGKAIITEVYV